jgi:hypothetical protein
VVKGVDRLLENLLFPAVGASASAAAGDEDDQRSAAGTVGGAERKASASRVEGGSRRSGEVRLLDPKERRERRERRSGDRRRSRREGRAQDGNGSIDSVGSLTPGSLAGCEEGARPGQHRASVWEEERDAKWGGGAAAAATAGRRALMLEGSQASPQDFYEMYKAASMGVDGGAPGGAGRGGRGGEVGWQAADDWMGDGGSWKATAEAAAADGAVSAGRRVDAAAKSGAGPATGHEDGWGGEAGQAWMAGGFQPQGEDDEDAWAAGIERWRD